MYICLRSEVSNTNTSGVIDINRKKKKRNMAFKCRILEILSKLVIAYAEYIAECNL